MLCSVIEFGEGSLSTFFIIFRICSNSFIISSSTVGPVLISQFIVITSSFPSRIRASVLSRFIFLLTVEVRRNFAGRRSGRDKNFGQILPNSKQEPSMEAIVTFEMKSKIRKKTERLCSD